MALCAGGCALGVVVFAVTGAALGQGRFVDLHLLVVVLVVAATGALFTAAGQSGIAVAAALAAAVVARRASAFDTSTFRRIR
jgi:hypothetical protein